MFWNVLILDGTATLWRPVQVAHCLRTRDSWDRLHQTPTAMNAGGSAAIRDAFVLFSNSVTASFQAGRLAKLHREFALKELGVFFFEKKKRIQTFETSVNGPLLGQVKYRVSVISHTLIISPNEQLFTTAWLTQSPRKICSVSLPYECGPPKRWAAIKKGSCHSEVAIV